MIRLLKASFIVFCIIACTAVHAQRISFCEKVDAKGNPINISDRFEIDRKGGFLNFHVNLPAEIGHSSVTYDLFWVDSTGTEHFANSIKQRVQPGWMKFWKQMDFYRGGRYRVYVYDDFDRFLCGGELRVMMR